MTINRDYKLGDGEFSCDGKRCTETFDFDLKEDWDQVIGELRAAKWHLTKQGGTWLHYCEDCWHGNNNR